MRTGMAWGTPSAQDPAMKGPENPPSGEPTFLVQLPALGAPPTTPTGRKPAAALMGCSLETGAHSPPDHWPNRATFCGPGTCTSPHPPPPPATATTSPMA